MSLSPTSTCPETSRSLGESTRQRLPEERCHFESARNTFGGPLQPKSRYSSTGWQSCTAGHRQNKEFLGFEFFSRQESGGAEASKIIPIVIKSY
jgi:hypothetical protein